MERCTVGQLYHISGSRIDIPWRKAICNVSHYTMTPFSISLKNERNLHRSQQNVGAALSGPLFQLYLLLAYKHYEQFKGYCTTATCARSILILDGHCGIGLPATPLLPQSARNIRHSAHTSCSRNFHSSSTSGTRIDIRWW